MLCSGTTLYVFMINGMVMTRRSSPSQPALPLQAQIIVLRKERVDVGNMETETYTISDVVVRRVEPAEGFAFEDVGEGASENIKIGNCKAVSFGSRILCR
ncbi:MAG: hypothetical protein Q9N34_08605 [Aquificota bacterium]|nr:hypothetical protein [Aquificota bacterium]